MDILFDLYLLFQNSSIFSYLGVFFQLLPHKIEVKPRISSAFNFHPPFQVNISLIFLNSQLTNLLFVSHSSCFLVYVFRWSLENREMVKVVVGECGDEENW